MNKYLVIMVAGLALCACSPKTDNGATAPGTAPAINDEAQPSGKTDAEQAQSNAGAPSAPMECVLVVKPDYRFTIDASGEVKVIYGTEDQKDNETAQREELRIAPEAGKQAVDVLANAAKANGSELVDMAADSEADLGKPRMLIVYPGLIKTWPATDSQAYKQALEAFEKYVPADTGAGPDNCWLAGTLEHEDLEGGIWKLKTDAESFVLVPADDKMSDADMIGSHKAGDKVRVTGSVSDDMSIQMAGRLYKVIGLYDLQPVK
ncbi:MAG: hypothetical protein K6G50_09565 [bacterium]|nr:hypothetical protein [bacterium]